jgi:hypothetical protein
MSSTRRRWNHHADEDRPGPVDLPDLDDVVQLLDTEDTDVRPPLHALTIDRVLLAGASGESTATWVGTGQHAQTTSLHDLAPAPRVLDRIEVARGFTPYQHHALVQKAIDRLDATSVLFVVPAVDAPYRDSDLPDEDAREMLLRVLAQLASVPRQYNIPVLVTRTGTDSFGEAVGELAADTLTYRETRCGPRFEGGDHETLVYDLGGGWVQTTLAYWQQVLDSRQALYASTDSDVPSPGEVW